MGQGEIKKKTKQRKTTTATTTTTKHVFNSYATLELPIDWKVMSPSACKVIRERRSFFCWRCTFYYNTVYFQDTFDSIFNEERHNQLVARGNVVWMECSKKLHTSQSICSQFSPMQNTWYFFARAVKWRWSEQDLYPRRPSWINTTVPPPLLPHSFRTPATQAHW